MYQRKLYALLRDCASDSRAVSEICQKLNFLSPDIEMLNRWWQEVGYRANDIGSSSDRVNLSSKSNAPTEICHPVSGEGQSLQLEAAVPLEVQAACIEGAFTAINQGIENSDEVDKRIFWWCWRFYPELVSSGSRSLLYPTHPVLPDNPLYSHNSTVSALAGTLFPQGWQQGDAESKPYLLLFTFSPVQEFIKASRKFLDFWSSSYMLHYLSARLCWYVAQQYGPDAVITPSLWGQDIIDALLLKEYPEFVQFFEEKHPVSHCEFLASRSLRTAGFPNTITVLVSGKEEAIALGQELSATLKQLWGEIAQQVRADIKTTVMGYLKTEGVDKLWEAIGEDFDSPEKPNPYRRELEQYQQPGCWEWNTLWEAQISHTWEPYFVAVPLGSPEQDLIHADTQDQEWIQAQNEIAQPRDELPTIAEQQAYHGLNVGTWWGSLQARLGQGLQVVKNSRHWQFPVSPGERSSLSGQYSAVHPRCNYARFKQGRGMTAGSIRLFWRVMGLAYPGLFDGSERLNALELTKRMAWNRGGVAEILGIKPKANDREENDYEGLIRFPNLNSIAAARFAADHPEKVREYWSTLSQGIRQDSQVRNKHGKFGNMTRGRPFQIAGADAALAEDYNGVMFSSKWLAEDMGLPQEEIPVLRSLVAQAHQQSGFGESSPADWWVLVLGDGDGMGGYVSGRSLKSYDEYLVQALVDRTDIQDNDWKLLLKTKKRMGPATHVGLNRALLDFSNRLVPYLTEKRFCGRVIYSGGDDVMAVLPLADLPEFLQSLRAAWCGGEDPKGQFDSQGGYWHPKEEARDVMGNIPQRPLFTMGKGASMSCGIVIAHKSVPLPTVLEQIWDAEKERAKKLLGGGEIPPKDGLCFRVIYGSGNTLEAMMKGHLLEPWWEFVQAHTNVDLSPVLYRLAEVLPQHVVMTEHDRLCRQAATAILNRRDEALPDAVYEALLDWLDAWEQWAWLAQKTAERRQKKALGATINDHQTAERKQKKALGTTLADLANLLRFTAFWVARRRQELSWGNPQQEVEDA
jgi:CRISPR-associated protein Cmr2